MSTVCNNSTPPPHCLQKSSLHKKDSGKEKEEEKEEEEKEEKESIRGPTVPPQTTVDKNVTEGEGK